MILSVVISQRDDAIGTSITVAGLLQSLKGLSFEIIVVDNSEENQRFAIDKEYLQDGTVKLLYTSPPSLFAARAEGIKHARGRWILILDSHMLMGYRGIEELLEVAEGKDGNLGIVYGSCLYHVQNDRNGFIDRDLTTLFGIRNGDDFSTRRIAFRGVPMLMEKAHFMRIGGYGTLARNYLPWGGGDFLLGIKTLMMGFENWAVPKARGIHLGPFKKGPLTSSYMRVNDSKWPDFIGMMTAAFIVGGRNLLQERRKQVEKRIGRKKKSKGNISYGEIERMAMRLGKTDYEMLRDNMVYSFYKLRKMYKR